MRPWHDAGLGRAIEGERECPAAEDGPSVDAAPAAPEAVTAGTAGAPTIAGAKATNGAATRGADTSPSTAGVRPGTGHGRAAAAAAGSLGSAAHPRLPIAGGSRGRPHTAVPGLSATADPAADEAPIAVVSGLADAGDPPPAATLADAGTRPAATVEPRAPLDGGGAVPLHLAGEVLALLPAGAAWHAASRTLIVADLHLEKASSFARRGQLLPPYDSAATLARLAALVAAVRPSRLVALGDSFHDRGGPARLGGAETAALARLAEACDLVWITGNHDPELPASLGGRVAETLVLGGLVLRHVPSGTAAGEVAGHLHPVARVAGRGRAVRRRCFATDGHRLVLPAFGSLAGGLNVLDRAFHGVLARSELTTVLIGAARLYRVAAGRLLPG